MLGHDPQTAGLDWRQRLGIVLQTSQGLDLLTVREVVASTAKVYRHPRGVDEVLEAVGLTEKRAAARLTSQAASAGVWTWPWASSAGRLLFLDETTTGFDPGRAATLGPDSASPRRSDRR